MSLEFQEFVQIVRSSGEPCPLALRQIERKYAGICPVSMQNEDVRLLLSVTYLAVRFFKPRSVLQTGTFIGGTSVAIGLALKQNRFGSLITIDPEPPEYFGVPNPVSVARRIALESGLEKQIEFVRGYSTMPLDGKRQKLVAGPTWQIDRIARKAPYDMLVVDGDHTFLGCYMDLVHGVSGLSAQGPRLMIVHDYVGIPEVRSAVDRWMASRPSAPREVLTSACGIFLAQV